MTFQWKVVCDGEMVEIETERQVIRLTRNEAFLMREVLADALQLMPVEIKP